MSENSGYRTLLAGEAIAANLLVKLKANTTTTPPEVAIAGSNEAFIGSAVFAAANGDPVTIRLHNCAGTVELVANEAIAIGASLYTGAAGKVTDTAPANPVVRALALEAASADGAVIECLIL